MKKKVFFILEISVKRLESNEAGDIKSITPMIETVKQISLWDVVEFENLVKKSGVIDV